MKCPYCLSTDTKVIDKRESDEGLATRRRRECLKCEKRFTTYERVQTIDIVVIKKDGSRQAFDRQKILTGIIKACEKRSVSTEKIEKVVNEIEAKIFSSAKNEVPSTKSRSRKSCKIHTYFQVYMTFFHVYKSCSAMFTICFKKNQIMIHCII